MSSPPSEPPLRFKVADSLDETEQSLRLLHDAYVKRGVMKPHRTGLRVTKWHLLPTTDILVAKAGNVVVGTLSVIRDSLMQLPIDKMWNLTDLRKEAYCLAEISSLALKDEMRMQPMKTLMPLISFLMHYLHLQTSIDVAVIATHIRSRAFYSDNLAFQPVSSEVFSYDFVQGAESYAQYVRPATYWEMVNGKLTPTNIRHLKRAQFIVKNPHLNHFEFPEPHEGYIAPPLVPLGQLLTER